MNPDHVGTAAPFYAHTLRGLSEEHWQPLYEHLQEVAELAAKHAEAFGSAAWGRAAALLHDVGKYAEDFQVYLRKAANELDVVDASVLDARTRSGSGRVDHSTAGAVRVYELCASRVSAFSEMPGAELALAMVIAGHHAGLPARQTDEVSFVNGRLTPDQKRARLEAARRHGKPEIDAFLDVLPSDLPAILTRKSTARDDKSSLRYEFWTRMLFSALIDADRLNTEEFTEPERAEERKALKVEDGVLKALRDRVDAHLEKVADGARGKTADAVFRLRAAVLADCRKAAERPPGRHSLTVPTGGGKTLAALAFGLDHAIRYGLRRVIFVIPFTSIIDQTARVYREAFGKEYEKALIEHHSNLDPTKESYENRLASENWDAPVIVTTSVQFFESLFSNRGTAARKLHNIAKSVVVFDEVQSLPHGLRKPIFDVLNRLVDDYGVSALFCTATQPALEMKEANRLKFPHLADVCEVVQDVAGSFDVVKNRVVAEFRDVERPTTWEEIAAEIGSEANPRVLAIVDRRTDARDLWQRLKENKIEAFHLSALMCAEHRRKVLAEIAEALKSPARDCRVVSTTLVEAGVDLDFPVVYRVLGGVDALAQAAGRCNRGGALTDAEGRPIPGRLIVFRPTTESPRGLDRGRSTTQGMLRASDDASLDLFDPATYERYFRRYLMDVDPDAKRVMPARENRDFPKVVELFRMIDDGGQGAVVVPYGKAAKRVERYREFPCRDTLRALQPYIVNIPQRLINGLERQGAVETIHDQVHWIAPGPKQYDEQFGLIVDHVAPLPAGDLIA